MESTVLPPATKLAPRSQQALRRFRHACSLDRVSAVQRLFDSPSQMLLSKALKPLRRRRELSFRVRASLFWGEKMTVLMPEGWVFVRYGRYEDELTEYLLNTLREGMRFVDVGAHFGYFSMLAAHLVGPQGQVHSFEPTPRTFRILTQNLGGRTNVTLTNKAVFSSSTTIRMFDMGPGLAGYNSFVKPRLADADRDVKGHLLDDVRTVSLDEYTASWPSGPTFMKIDAESAESEILRGMETTLRRLRPTLAMEVGDFDIPGVPGSRDVIQQIVARGYTAHSLASGRLLPHELQSRYEPGVIVLVPKG